MGEVLRWEACADTVFAATVIVGCKKAVIVGCEKAVIVLSGCKKAVVVGCKKAVILAVRRLSLFPHAVRMLSLLAVIRQREVSPSVISGSRSVRDLWQSHRSFTRLKLLTQVVDSSC